MHRGRCPDQSAPNEILNSLLHITVNANGVVTAFVDNFSFECRG
jgi:hypothetical protein